MPGRFALQSPLARLASDLGHSVDALGEEVARANIAPGQDIVVLTGAGWQRMRWGIIPVGRKNARGRPVLETLVNARSETLFSKSAFEGTGRGVVPADHWYEWTGAARRKTPWRIRPADGRLLLFAAITDVWTAPGGLQVPQVATVTCPPSGDVIDIHDRMGVLLELEDIDTWLHGTPEDCAPLMRPWPDGRLVVEPASDVDFSAP